MRGVWKLKGCNILNDQINKLIFQRTTARPKKSANRIAAQPAPLFHRNTGSIRGVFDPLYPFIFLAWHGVRESTANRRHDPFREGLFGIAKKLSDGLTFSEGIILPVMLCRDDDIKNRVVELIDDMSRLKNTHSVQTVRRKLHQKLNAAGLSWLRIEPGSELSGFVGLVPTRELFFNLQKHFPMVSEILDQPGQNIRILKTKEMPWFSRGDLMEWIATLPERQGWSDVKVYPFLVFGSAEGWQSKLKRDWKSPAIEICSSRTSELLTPLPGSRAACLSVEFILKEYGWAVLKLQIDESLHEIQLSSVFPPFWDLLTWTKMIDRGEMPVSVTIDEEGTEKVLSVEKLHNSDLLLFKLAEKYETGYLVDALVSRKDIVDKMSNAFRVLLDTGFDPDEWSSYSEESGEVPSRKMTDDEWFRRNL